MKGMCVMKRKVIGTILICSLLAMTGCNTAEPSVTEATTTTTEVTTTTPETTTTEVTTTTSETTTTTTEVTTTTPETTTTTEVTTTTPETTTTTPETTTTTEVTATTPVITTTTEATTTAAETETSEEEMVIEIAEKGYKAMVERDYEGVMKYTNLDAVYYLTFGEWAEDEVVIERLKIATEPDDNNIFAWMGQIKDMEFLNAEQVTAEELAEYNAFISHIADVENPDYAFTDAYKVYLSYPDMSESEKAMIGTDNGVHLLVVEYDGEWKMDFYVSVTKSIMDSIGQMTQQ